MALGGFLFSLSLSPVLGEPLLIDHSLSHSLSLNQPWGITSNTNFIIIFIFSNLDIRDAKNSDQTPVLGAT